MPCTTTTKKHAMPTRVRLAAPDPCLPCFFFVIIVPIVGRFTAHRNPNSRESYKKAKIMISLHIKQDVSTAHLTEPILPTVPNA